MRFDPDPSYLPRLRIATSLNPIELQDRRAGPGRIWTPRRIWPDKAGEARVTLWTPPVGASSSRCWCRGNATPSGWGTRGIIWRTSGGLAPSTPVYRVWMWPERACRSDRSPVVPNQGRARATRPAISTASSSVARPWKGPSVTGAHRGRRRRARDRGGQSHTRRTSGTEQGGGKGESKGGSRTLQKLGPAASRGGGGREATGRKGRKGRGASSRSRRGKLKRILARPVDICKCLACFAVLYMEQGAGLWTSADPPWLPKCSSLALAPPSTARGSRVRMTNPRPHFHVRDVVRGTLGISSVCTYSYVPIRSIEQRTRQWNT